ncbi:hypothetical protein SAMN05660297_02709 [Natronincola peptidivorans]|uniref:Uncharacterized protein n=1 Tax=Natronincola peptidivorans TaxID=426128 RepID=A0A1I0FAY7_9FIRM|nr:hypothetical protein [Natronincola peptidivorans]SET54474.1 hypothetical protein SAMN05660297_02709 [Natronincola peptidivorans]
MKKKPLKKDINENFFREMNYELAGDIGAIDNEEMINNKKLMPGKKHKEKSGVKNQNKKS